MKEQVITWSFRGNTYKFPYQHGEQTTDGLFVATIRDLQIEARSDKSYDDAAERLDGSIYSVMNTLEFQGRLNMVDRFIDGAKKPYYAPNVEFMGDAKFDGVEGDKTYRFPVRVYKDYDFYLAEITDLKIKGYSRSSPEEAFEYLKQTVYIVFQSPEKFDVENVRLKFLVPGVPEIVIDNVGEGAQGEVGSL